MLDQQKFQEYQAKQQKVADAYGSQEDDVFSKQAEDMKEKFKQSALASLRSEGLLGDDLDSAEAKRYLA